MVSQLRIYTIIDGRLDDFVKAWRAGVYPLRVKQGYKIQAAWLNRETNQFIWILTYDGSEDWQTKDDAYYASPERAAVKPDPAQYIAKAEKWFVSPIQLAKD